MRRQNDDATHCTIALPRLVVSNGVRADDNMLLISVEVVTIQCFH